MRIIGVELEMFPGKKSVFPEYSEITLLNPLELLNFPAYFAMSTFTVSKINLDHFNIEDRPKKK